MTENSRTIESIDYDYELAKDFKKNLRFYLKELELVSDEDHVEEIIGEILYLGINSDDIKIKAYINRKMKEFGRNHPDYQI